VSNSDAHSLEKLGREANVFDLKRPTYDSLIEAVRTRKGFVKTYEFYPEEGKYHYDGHRDCKVILTPWETDEKKGICPVCKKKVTVGVLNRVYQLSDRKLGFRPKDGVDFQHIVPLPTIISKAIKKPETSKKVAEEYDKIVRYFGTEFALFDAPEDKIKFATSTEIADAIIKVRRGNISWVPGFDGEFGQLILKEMAASPKRKSVNKNQTKLDEF
jgi:PHP family Zn ribbon phosphoesterase